MILSLTPPSIDCHPFVVPMSEDTMKYWEFIAPNFFSTDGVLPTANYDYDGFIINYSSEFTSLVDCLGNETFIQNPVDANYCQSINASGDNRMFFHLRKFTKLTELPKDKFYLKYKVRFDNLSTGDYQEFIFYSQYWFKDYTCYTNVTTYLPCLNVNIDKIYPNGSGSVNDHLTEDDFKAGFYDPYSYGQDSFQTVKRDVFYQKGNLSFVYSPQAYLRGGYPVKESFSYDFTQQNGRTLKIKETIKKTIFPQEFGSNYLDTIQKVFSYGKFKVIEWNNWDVMNLTSHTINLKDRKWKHKYYVMNSSAETFKYLYKGCTANCYFGDEGCCINPTGYGYYCQQIYEGDEIIGSQCTWSTTIGVYSTLAQCQAHCVPITPDPCPGIFNFDVSCSTWNSVTWTGTMPNPTDNASMESWIKFYGDNPFAVVTDFCRSGNRIKCNISNCVNLEFDTNNVTSLKKVPNNLQGLYINTHTLTHLVQLPASLYSLYISDFNNNNTLQTIAGLSSYTNLNTLYIYGGNIGSMSSLGALPNNIRYLTLNHLNLTDIPNIPSDCEDLNLLNNHLVTLPTFNCVNLLKIGLAYNDFDQYQLDVIANNFLCGPKLVWSSNNQSTGAHPSNVSPTFYQNSLLGSVTTVTF